MLALVGSTVVLGAVAAALVLASAVSADTGGYPYANMPCEHPPYAATGTCRDDDWGPTRDGSQASTFDPATGYGYRNCTDYVAWRLMQLGVPARKIRGLHNGGQWAQYAPANGLAVSATPRVGEAAVAVGEPGHVAFVAAVNGSQITVDEYNQHETGAYSTQTGTPASLGFEKFVDFGVKSPGSGNPGGSGGTGLPSTASGGACNPPFQIGSKYPFTGPGAGWLSTYGGCWKLHTAFSDATLTFADPTLTIETVRGFVPSGADAATVDIFVTNTSSKPIEILQAGLFSLYYHGARPESAPNFVPCLPVKGVASTWWCAILLPLQTLAVPGTPVLQFNQDLDPGTGTWLQYSLQDYGFPTSSTPSQLELVFDPNEDWRTSAGQQTIVGSFPNTGKTSSLP